MQNTALKLKDNLGACPPTPTPMPSLGRSQEDQDPRLPNGQTGMTDPRVGPFPPSFPLRARGFHTACSGFPALPGQAFPLHREASTLNAIYSRTALTDRGRDPAAARHRGTPRPVPHSAMEKEVSWEDSNGSLTSHLVPGTEGPRSCWHGYTAFPIY